MQRFFLLSAVAALLPVAQPLAAQQFDHSGTAGVSGPYLFRYVNFFNDQFGNLTESCSLTGVMNFDGQGRYTTTSVQLFDSLTPGSCTSLGGGTYGVQSNGLAQFDNPLYPATLFGSVSQPVIIASSTEDFYFDLFIAVKAPAGAVANGSFSGIFTAATLDFPNASAATARQGYFTIHADGQGNIAAFPLHGSAANLNPMDVVQNIPASTYTLSGTAGGTLTVPVAGQLTSQTQILSGAKTLFISSDGNYVLGGSPDGSDMIFGFRAPSGAASNALLSGTYFMGGMADDASTNLITAFFGAINTNGTGNLIRHERVDYVATYETYDFTANTPVTIGADGSYYDGSTFTWLAGSGGMALMRVGSGRQFSLTVAVRAPYLTSSAAVWINPFGVTNAANYTPITNAYAPGELISLYGNFGVSFQEAQVLPIPKTLGGVQVLVNGQPAPVFLVSPNQVSALVPYAVAGEYFATFEVVVNGTRSNAVTVYADYSSPGIYTLTENGIGPGAILHADYTLVSESSPAAPGETVLLFMNGLGTVTPALDDGAAASGANLSYTDEYISVYLDDGVNPQAYANAVFTGLAPGFSGLYQVNFTLPASGVTNGKVWVLLYTSEAISEMAEIPVQGFPAVANSAPPSARPRLTRARQGRRARPRRRALPDRM